MTPTDEEQDRDRSAGTRGAVAGRRADELKARRQDLARGIAPSEQSAEQALRRAEESRQRALDAHAAAVARHREAGEAHLVAAAMHEQAAMQGGGDNGEEHLDAAERHRREARFHEAAAKEIESNEH